MSHPELSFDITEPERDRTAWQMDGKSLPLIVVETSGLGQQVTYSSPTDHPVAA